jgi:hypothetical protein
MAYKTTYMPAYCKICGENVKAEAQIKETNHILHLILSILTGGIWLVIWLLIAVSSNGEKNIKNYSCTKCGNKKLKKPILSKQNTL